MATTAEIGYGAALTAGGVAISQVVDSDWALSVNSDKVSSQGSPVNANGGFWVEKIPTSSDAGKVTFNVVYKTTVMVTLFGLVGAKQTWQVTFPDTHVFACTGFITSLKKGTPLETHETIDVEVELTGAPTYT